MKTRIITGACYVAVLVSFFLLREFVDARIFHLFIAFLVVGGTFETARMMRGRAIDKIQPLAIVFSVVFIASYLVIGYFFEGLGWAVALGVVSVSLIALCVYAITKKISSTAFLASIMPFVYPTLLLLPMFLANDMQRFGFTVLLLSFVISPLSDTFAYFVGSLIGGKKLCPRISPKKTWSGAIGGIVGGAIGSLVVYFIFTPKINFFSPILFFILIGVIASIVNIFGDLFESVLKRKVGVKDSGKILPGHGGILDRIDGTSFVIVFLYFIFLLV